jgi:hypothetical protein
MYAFTWPEHTLSKFPVVVNIHNARVSTYKTCPWCNSDNLEYPVYRDKYVGSGLITPLGNIDDDKLIHPLGVLRPAATTSGWSRPAPSGLTHTFDLENLDYWKESYSYYEEVAYYQPYWTCNTCRKFFVYPEVATGSIVASGWGLAYVNVPSGSQFV